MIGTGSDQTKISADGADRLVKSFDGCASPHQAAGREALLHARGQQQILFDFAMALLELDVHVAQLILGALLRGNIRKGYERKDLPIRIFDLPRSNYHRQATAIVARHVEFKKVAAFPLAALDLTLQRLRFFGRIPTGDFRADHVVRGFPNHFQIQSVGENNFATIVVDQHALIERFQNAANSIQPFMRYFRHRSASCASLKNRLVDVDSILRNDDNTTRDSIPAATATTRTRELSVTKPAERYRLIHVNCVLSTRPQDQLDARERQT